jgi:hypothetical protein
MSKEEIVYQESTYREVPVVTIHSTEQPIAEARYAMQLAERFALIAGEDNGEDSAGRQKLRLATPDEVVQRACNIAHLMFTEIRDRNWMLPVEAWDVIQEVFESKREERRKKDK